MKSENELRILRCLEASIADGSTGSKKIGFYIWACNLFGIAGVGLGLVLCVEPTIPVSVPVIIAAAGGFLLGAAVYARKSLEQLSIIRNHVNSDSLKARIEDIDKQPAKGK